MFTIDFFENNLTLFIAFDILILIAIFYLLKPSYILKKDVMPNSIFGLSLFLVLCFCLFSLWGGDWIHYYQIFNKITSNPYYVSHMEDVYVFLVRYCSYDYLIFRLILWGSALYLVWMTIKEIGLHQQLTWFIFSLLFLPIFSYARVSLSVAMMFFGAVFFVNNYEQRKYWSAIIGLILICISFYFHKSSALGILAIFFSFIFNPAHSKNARYYLFAFFCLSVFVARFFISQFMSADFGDSDEYIQTIATKGSSYMTREEGSGRFISYLRTILEQGTYALCAILAYKVLDEYSVPSSIALSMKILFFIVFMAFLFKVDLGVNTSTLSGRLFRFSLIPASITLSYTRSYNIYPKLTNFTFVYGLMASVFFVSYSFYCSFYR